MPLEAELVDNLLTRGDFGDRTLPADIGEVITIKSETLLLIKIPGK